MRDKRIFNGLFFCLLALFSGCADKDISSSLPENEEATVPTNAIFRLNVVINGGGMTRTEDHTAPGNSMENSINTLHLFAVPLVYKNGEETEGWEEMRYGEVLVEQPFRNPVTVMMEGLCFHKMNVYVGANMDKEQVSYFRHAFKNDYYEIKNQGDFENYASVINQFAPFASNGVNQRDNIVMFCRELKRVDLAQPQYREDPDKIDLGKIEMMRVVAKILVTCQVADKEEVAEGALDGEKYMRLSQSLVAGQGPDESGPKSPKGWMRQNDVYYFINNMPRRIRFRLYFRDVDGDGYKETPLPYYNLKDIIVGECGARFTPLFFDDKAVRNVYIHANQTELFKRNYDFRPTSVWSEKAYNDLISNRGGAYHQEGIGMYTLDNMFSMGGADNGFTADELAQLDNYPALPILPHVVIAAKFTPKYIVGLKKDWEEELTTDGVTYPAMKTVRLSDGTPLADAVILNDAKTPGYNDYIYMECRDEETAQKILTYSLAMHGTLKNAGEEYDPDVPHIYPADTYFVYFDTDNTYFCSFGAAANNNDTPGQIRLEMVPYTNGWTYYYTYINNEDEGEVKSIRQSVIERNRYYILKVNSVTKLGASISDPGYIKVYTKKSDWQDGGDGNITLN